RARRSRRGRSSSTIKRVLSSLIWGALCPLGAARSILLWATQGGVAVDHPARPGHADPRAFSLQIQSLDRAAGLLEQGLGDEEAEPHPLVLAERLARSDLALPQSIVAGARRDVGLADALEDLRRESRPIILD